jgi:hypothetical protein
MLEPVSMARCRGQLLNDDNCLRCPVCRYEYNHIECVYTRKGTDPQEAGIYDGTKAVGTVTDGERRSCLVIELTCESGHRWELRLQQHKGNVLVSAEGIPIAA